MHTNGCHTQHPRITAGEEGPAQCRVVGQGNGAEGHFDAILLLRKVCAGKSAAHVVDMAAGSRHCQGVARTAFHPLSKCSVHPEVADHNRTDSGIMNAVL